MRKALAAVTTGLIVVTYPLVWALGYQDHPWHWHTAADVVALLAAIGATSVHALREALDPPLRRWTTGLALVVTYGALVSAMFWDWAGRPSDADVLGGPGFFLMPLLAVVAALGMSALVVTVVRRRLAGRTREA